MAEPRKWKRDVLKYWNGSTRCPLWRWAMALKFVLAVWMLTWLMYALVVHLYLSCCEGQPADNYTDTTLVKRKKRLRFLFVFNLNSNHSSQAEASDIYLHLYCFMKLNSSRCSFPAVILIFVGSPAFPAWFLWYSHGSWFNFLLNWPWNVHKLEHRFSTFTPWTKTDFLSQSGTESLFMKIFCSLSWTGRSGLGKSGWS